MAFQPKYSITGQKEILKNWHFSAHLDNKNLSIYEEKQYENAILSKKEILFSVR